MTLNATQIVSFFTDSQRLIKECNQFASYFVQSTSVIFFLIGIVPDNSFLKDKILYLFFEVVLLKGRIINQRITSFQRNDTCTAYEVRVYERFSSFIIATFSALKNPLSAMNTTLSLIFISFTHRVMDFMSVIFPLIRR